MGRGSLAPGGCGHGRAFLPPRPGPERTPPEKIPPARQAIGLLRPALARDPLQEVIDRDQPEEPPGAPRPLPLPRPPPPGQSGARWHGIPPGLAPQGRLARTGAAGGSSPARRARRHFVPGEVMEHLELMDVAEDVLRGRASPPSRSTGSASGAPPRGPPGARPRAPLLEHLGIGPGHRGASTATPRRRGRCRELLGALRARRAGAPRRGTSTASCRPRGRDHPEPSPRARRGRG